MPVLPEIIFKKIYMLGEKGSGIQANGRVQNFYKLREKHLKNGTLFEDENFPANDSSLYFSETAKKKYSEVKWKRPREISNNPKLFVEGHSRFDAVQGNLGDCWLIDAIATLASHKDLLSRIIPDDQDFKETYAGIFHFRFWQYGRWIDVVIDDRLPVYGCSSGRIFSGSADENEFWSSLLEKAYAKLYGSYEALDGGNSCEASQDFTGGLTENYVLPTIDMDKILLRAYKRSALMGCAVMKLKERKLIGAHSYSITRIKYVQIKNSDERVLLIRLRNPWGEKEWNGPWSDRSSEWQTISKQERENLGLSFKNNGEFWMSYEDFQKHCTDVCICNLFPHSLSEAGHRNLDEQKWHVSCLEDEWVKGVTAGGCSHYDSFNQNPQYQLTLTEADDDGQCELVIALMQKHRRAQKHLGVKDQSIRYEIYQLENIDEVSTPLDKDFFQVNHPKFKFPMYDYLPESNSRFKVPPGTYCIIPFTTKKQGGQFFLRVYSKQPFDLKEYDDVVDYNSDNVDEKVKSTRDDSEQEDEQAYQQFLKHAGEDGGINWIKLKDILDNVMKVELRDKSFSKEVCRSMVALLDPERSGELGFEEFKNLWSDIQNWKNVFHLHDKDQSQMMSAFELRKALNSAGYHVNFRILNILMHRYGNQEGQLEFEDFIMCAVKLKTMINIFKQMDPENTKNATFSLEDWMENTLYA